MDYNCRHTDSFLLHNLSVGASTATWLLPVGTSTATNLNYVTSTPVVIRLATYNATWGCRDTATVTLTPINMVPYYTASDTTLCGPSLISFASSSDTSNRIYKYSWWLGHQLVHVDSASSGCGGITYPSSSSFMDSITHVGIDTMTLIITDIHGCADTFTRHLYLTEPVAAFKALPSTGCWPMAVVFTDTTVHPAYAPIDSIMWSFGDGGTAFLHSDTAHHLYTTNTSTTAFDTFDVREIITNRFGCKDTIIKTGYIHEFHPHADFNDAVFCQGVGGTFLQATYNFDHSTIIWNFGNGFIDTVNDLSVFYTYPDTGVYLVTAIVIDSIGCRDTFSSHELVTHPHAAFAMSDSFLICPPFNVNFMNSSTFRSGSGTYNWDFGDGSPSTLPNPTHAYSSGTTGDLIVTLTATDGRGCSDVTHHTLHFMSDTGGFTYPGMGCSPLVEHFTPVIGYVDSIKWEFGDLVTQVVTTSDTLNHIYLHPGIYVPQMIIYKHGCHILSRGIDTIKVDSMHTAFNFSPNPVCPYTPVTFHDASTSIYSTVNSWHWSFSTTDSSSSPIHSFGTSGPITLTSSTTWHCSDTETHYLTVYGHTLSAGSPALICPGGSTTLTASGGSGFLWYPSTGLSCTSCTSPNAHPATTTTYRVTGVNSYGCNDTATVTVTVDTPPVLSISNSLPFFCIGQSSTLTASGGTSYSWSPSGSLSSGVSNPVVATPSSTTTYTVTSANIHGCIGTATTTVTVWALPTVTVSAAPSASICPGASTTLTGAGATTYFWTPSAYLSSVVGNPIVATPAITTTYTLTGIDAHGCSSNAIITVNIYTPPSITLIGNTGPLCNGGNILLYDSVSGGAPGYTYSWTGPAGYTSTAHNPVLSSVTTAMNGWYVLTVTDAHGCTKKDSTNVSSYTPTVFSISGDTSICYGFSTTLTASPSSGLTFSWLPTGTLSCPTCAVTNAHPTATTTYTITATNSYGCVYTTTKTVIINPLPVVPPIMGNPELCIFSSTFLTDSMDGGLWSNSDGAIISTYPYAGYVDGVSAGTAIVTYTVTDIHGCVGYDTILITVYPLPVLPPITGDTIMCMGGVYTLHDSLSGGTWETYDSSIAYVDATTGVVTTVDTGFTGFDYYYVDSHGCQSIVEFYIYVAPVPILDAIAQDTVCAHDSALIATSLPGGTWTSSDPAIADAAPSGYIVGHSGGTVLLTYTVTNSYGCSSSVSNFFTVIPFPSLSIAAADTVCLSFATPFSDSVTGGVWTSSDTTIATVDGMGNVVGVGEGAATITHTVSNWHCTSTITHGIYVLAPPAVPAITGDDLVCIGGSMTLTESYTGGFWVVQYDSVATIDSFGGVTGVSEGTTLVGYVAFNYCGVGYALDTITVVPPVPPITGVPAVCSGSVTDLGNIVPGGTWTSSNTSVATVDAATGEVYGVGYGTTTISYTATGPCGPFTATVVVRVDMAPIITTNFIVACQSLGSGGTSSKFVAMGSPSGPGDPVIITDADGCLLVCENTTVRYYGHGVDSSRFTWTCLGGTIVATYGTNADSIDILWPASGITGNVYVTDTFSHCTGEATLCVKVVSKPHADFTASSSSACLDDGILFFDNSTADTSAPITGWYWDFGDGSSFGDHYPPPHSYSSPGVYIVTLVVHNGCGCADTFHMKVSINDFPGPQIHCPSIVCENEVATYSIDSACGPVWVVTGGHIISGAGTTSITVMWDAPPADGYGYVTVTDTCGDCNDPSTVKVPIILNNAPISGAAFACANQQYEYSLPLWGGTDYQWGVLGYPGIIIGYNDDHKMVVSFPGPGTYTLHAWYQNRLKLCGGNVTKVVTVKGVASISGTTRICVGDSTSYVYTLSGGYSGDWTVRDPFGVVTTTTGPYPSHAEIFTLPGIYVVNAIGDFCVSPVNVIVNGLPPAIDSIVGDDTVCLNRIYSYKAYNDAPGTTYEWQAIGGSVVPASGSDEVDVIWTSTGTKQLLVRHEPDSEPHCDAPLFVMNIIQEQIDPAITGDTLPCSNSHRIYQSNYNRGDSYDWSIYPDSVGSVVSGYHSPDARVLWNNVVAPTPGYVIVKVQKCDTSVSDTLMIMLQPPPPVYITTPIAVICPGTGVVFTSHGIADSCIWDFGDGSSIHAIGGTTFHMYPRNLTSDNIVYTVRVTPIFGTDTTCPTSGVGFFHITVLPGPIAHISIASSGAWCPPATSELYGVVTDNIGTSTYEWFRNGVAIPSSNVVDYIASASYGESLFKMVVTSANGCTDTSNVVRYYSYCDPGDSVGPGSPPPPPDTGIGPGGHCIEGTTTASITHGCSAITLTGSTAGLPRWYAFTKPLFGDSWINHPSWSTIDAATAFAHYDTPGIYRFAYVVQYLSSYYGPEGCKDTIYIRDTIGIVPKFRTEIRCGPGNSDSVFFTDYSYHLSWWVPSTHLWSDGTGTGSGITYLGIYAAGSTVSMTETVSGLELGNPFSCDVTRAIHLPNRLTHFGYAYSPNNVCEGIPITFTPGSTAGVASFLWQFGNDGTNRLVSPNCAYAWNGLFNPKPITSHMIVTDTIGCTFDTSITFINVYRNDLFGAMDPGSAVCPNSIPFTISYFSTGGTPTSYAWSNGDSTFVPYTNVYSTGAYTVKVYDAHQCRFVPNNVENVKVLKVPTAQIRGRTNYCSNDIVQLNGYAGHSVGYQWYVDGATGSTTASTGGTYAVGTHTVTLVLSLFDTLAVFGPCTSSDTVIINVFDAPDAPIITGPTIVDCDLYHLQLSATATEAGFFNWSNGASGPVADIYTGGLIRVWFTNMAGCMSSADVNIPTAPSVYFQYLPSGCYDVCKGRMPITLCGPPHVSFDSWEWRKDGDTVSTGTGEMTPYAVLSGGAYQWALGNGLCTQKSDPMDITVLPCDNCKQANVMITVTCDTSDPVVYQINMNIFDPTIGDTYTLGTDGGPIMPFSGTISTYPTPLTLTFATIDTDATSVNVYVEMTHAADGTKCLYKEKVKLPNCSWIVEKPLAGGDSTKHPMVVTNAMLVYPNPATQQVTISYDYGEQDYKERSLTVYDQLGRKIQYTPVQDVHGSWSLNTADWTPGMYIIRMEADGKTLQTQRLIVNN